MDNQLYLEWSRLVLWRHSSVPIDEPGYFKSWDKEIKIITCSMANLFNKSSLPVEQYRLMWASCLYEQCLEGFQYGSKHR